MTWRLAAMSKSKNDALVTFAKELEPGTTMIPCGAIFTRRLGFLHQFSISEIKKARNSYAGWAFYWYLATVGTITTAAATSCSFWEIVMK